MTLYEIGVSTKVYANLYVRAESGAEAWEKAKKAWQLTDLDEDRCLEDAWQLDSIEPIGE